MTTGVDELRPWVTGVGVEVAGDRLVQGPDTATTLVLCTSSEEVHVVGPRARAGYFTGRGAGRTVVRLAPGRAQALLGVPVDPLVDEAVPLGELWGRPVRDVPSLRRGLAERAAAASSAASSPHLVAEAVRLLRSTSVAGTARALHVSERHLRTVFTRAVGFPPKRFARIERVRHVVRSGPESLSALAGELGYYDQAHLTADFRDVMGVPPGAFFAGRLPEATSC